MLSTSIHTGRACECVCAGAPVCVCARVEFRGGYLMSSSIAVPLVLRGRVSLNLTLTASARLAGYQSPETLLSLPPLCGDFRCTLPYSAFNVDAEDPSAGLPACMKSTFQTTSPPQKCLFLCFEVKYHKGDCFCGYIILLRGSYRLSISGLLGEYSRTQHQDTESLNIGLKQGFI